MHHYLLSNALNSMKMSPQREKSIVSKQISVQINMEREGKHKESKIFHTQYDKWIEFSRNILAVLAFYLA